MQHKAQSTPLPPKPSPRGGLAQSVVIGTSGHIDHGKTSLVRALTGIETDRLAEEKKRGITIDLGFAYSRTPQGSILAFVDVPGHERFVHNMLAGAAGIDVVMLVVAADEGVMPQTREHLNICHLLGATQGLVVLTKCDLVDEELLALSTEDVRETVQGTFLQQARVFAVSSTTGEGLPALRQALEALPSQRQPKATSIFRFIVDRSFAMKGFGTVVTGTAVAGSLSKQDDLLLYPQERKVRVRALQSHGQEVDRVVAGMRAAINLAAIHKDEISRGHQLAHEHALCVSSMLGVELQLLTSARALSKRVRVRVHVGAQEVMARVVLLERDQLLPGETQLAQLRLETPLCARYGERFVIRSYSPMVTIGGGRILDPAPVKLRKERLNRVARLAQLANASSDEERLEQVVWLRGTAGVAQSSLAALSGVGSNKAQKRCQNALVQAGCLRVLKQGSRQRLYHVDAILQLKTLIERLVARHHREYPDLAGPTQPDLAGKLGSVLTNQPLQSLLQSMCSQGQLQTNGDRFALPKHQGSLSSQEAALLKTCLAQLTQGGVQPPRRAALFEACGLNAKEGTRLLNRALHQGQAVRVHDDIYYAISALQTIQAELTQYLAQHQNISVVEFKDLLSIGRKQAVELLEYFDDQRLTLRVANTRILR